MAARKPIPAKPPSVATYFADQLGYSLPLADDDEGIKPWSPAHADFHIETGCGIECKKAIDAAAELMRHVREAGPREISNDLNEIARVTGQIVRIYVYG